jgi:titin
VVESSPSGQPETAPGVPGPIEGGDVRLASSHRRALGLLTAGTIGLSTALLGVTGVAHAAPGDTVAAEEVAAVLAVPSAPVEFEVVEVGDGFVTVGFQDGFYDPDVEAATTGYEISTDNGSTWGPLEVDDESYTWRYGTVSGLTNKESYTVVVRATSTAGPGAAGAPVTATPAKPIGAPAGLTVTTAAGKATATWSAPTDAGSYPLDGYVVGYFQPATENGGGAGGPLCQATAAELTCTGDLDFGSEWQISVAAIDAEGNRGVASASVSTGVIPFPATVPTSSGTLTPATGSSDEVVAGKTMVISGTGYQPGSTVTVLIYSSPQILTTVVADASGDFTVTVTVPAGLTAGQHTLVASGVDSSGNPRFTTLAVTVSTSGVATVAIPKLAATGADVTAPLLGGLAALAVGGGLIVVSRRRSAA